MPNLFNFNFKFSSCFGSWEFASSVSNPGFPEPETRVFCYFLTTRNPGFKIWKPGF